MYKNMEKICWYNEFDSWFCLWDMIDLYVINGRDLNKIPKDLRLVTDAIIEIISKE